MTSWVAKLICLNKYSWTLIVWMIERLPSNMHVRAFNLPKICTASRCSSHIINKLVQYVHAWNVSYSLCLSLVNLCSDHTIYKNGNWLKYMCYNDWQTYAKDEFVSTATTTMTTQELTWHWTKLYIISCNW